jgi:hypothetical protein
LWRKLPVYLNAFKRWQCLAHEFRRFGPVGICKHLAGTLICDLNDLFQLDPDLTTVQIGEAFADYLPKFP